MIFRQGQEDESVWAIWKIEETKEQLISMLTDKSLLGEVLSMKSETKILERLAVRVLLKQLVGEELQICYRDSGKPYLKYTNNNISISHTHGYVAVALSPLQYVGIDIQSITDKVKSVRDRFISNDEYIDPQHELIHLLLHWSAKETMYKSFGVPAVSLSDQLLVTPFIVSDEGNFQVREKVTGGDMSFIINYFFCEDFVFTYFFS